MQAAWNPIRDKESSICLLKTLLADTCGRNAVRPERGDLTEVLGETRAYDEQTVLPDSLPYEAGVLLDAERERRPVSLLSQRRTGTDLEDAYRVQWHGTALRVRSGAQIVGHKVGLTSEAMQRLVGIDEPDSGILLDRMLLGSDGTLAADELIAPWGEAEIAFRLDTDLAGENITEETVQAAVAEVFLAVEVIDSRFGTEPLTLIDSVADNAGCGRFVLGEGVPMPSGGLRDEQVNVFVDSDQVAAGHGRDVLGDPIRSVLWLARRLDSFGAGLRAGDLILAGAVHAAFPLEAGTTVSVTSTQLAPVSLHVT